MNIENYEYYKQNFRDPLIVSGCELFLTCGACPEQYEVFALGRYLGYLRLRHGSFTAQFGGVCGQVVLSGNPIGDGIFEPEEREQWLSAACQALLREYNQRVFDSSQMFA